MVSFLCYCISHCCRCFVIKVHRDLVLTTDRTVNTFCNHQRLQTVDAVAAILIFIRVLGRQETSGCVVWHALGNALSCVKSTAFYLGGSYLCRRLTLLLLGKVTGWLCGFVSHYCTSFEMQQGCRYGQPKLWTRDNTSGCWTSQQLQPASPLHPEQAAEPSPSDQSGHQQKPEGTCGGIEAEEPAAAEAAPSSPDATANAALDELLRSGLVLVEVEIPHVALMDGVHAKSFAGPDPALFLQVPSLSIILRCCHRQLIVISSPMVNHHRRVLQNAAANHFRFVIAYTASRHSS